MIENIMELQLNEMEMGNGGKEIMDHVIGVAEGMAVGGLTGMGVGAAVGGAVGSVPGACTGAIIGGATGMVAGSVYGGVVGVTGMLEHATSLADKIRSFF